MSATMCAFNSVIRYEGATVLALSMNNAVASLTKGSDCSPTDPRGGIGYTTSALSSRGSRLVAKTVRRGQDSTISATIEPHASLTCSQLSRTSITGRDPTTRARRAALCVAAGPESPSAVAIAGPTSPGSTTSAKGTQRTSVGTAAQARWDLTRLATSSAKRVFPAPPTPQTVTTLASSRQDARAAHSRSRPTKRVKNVGSGSPNISASIAKTSPFPSGRRTPSHRLVAPRRRAWLHGTEYTSGRS